MEVPLMDPWGFEASRARATLDSLGLASTLSVGLTGDSDVSQSAEQAERGEKLLNQALDQAFRLGSTHLVGNLFSALKRYSAPAPRDGRLRSQEILDRLATRAGQEGVTVALEVVNRYETNVFNTLRDAAAFTRETGNPNLKIHIDSFHMNIEEPDLYQPVLDVADAVGYVHVSENTRGYLSSGGVDFAQFFLALLAIKYDGPVTFETFSASNLSEDFASLLAVWRSFYDDTDDLATHAAQFIRQSLDQAAASAQV